MKIWKFLFLIIFSCLIAQPVFAYRISGNAVLTSGQNITAGITPDSPFYGIDVAMDRLRLFLTFDNVQKAKISLDIARERLMETKAMLDENKTEAASRAQREHGNSLSAVESSLIAIREKNATKELEMEVEIEKELEEHESEVEQVTKGFKIMIEAKGRFSPEQFQRIISILENLENKTVEVKIKIDLEKNETKIKIRETLTTSNEMIEKLVRDIEEKKGLINLTAARAVEKIEDAKEELDEIESKINETNLTQEELLRISTLLDQARSHLNNSESAFDENNFGKAFGQATATESISENINRILKQAEEKEEREEENESTSTTLDKSKCGWCGTKCMRLHPNIVCITIAPPSDKVCIEERGECKIKSLTSTTTTTTSTTTSSIPGGTTTLPTTTSTIENTTTSTTSSTSSTSTSTTATSSSTTSTIQVQSH